MITKGLPVKVLCVFFLSALQNIFPQSLKFAVASRSSAIFLLTSSLRSAVSDVPHRGFRKHQHLGSTFHFEFCILLIRVCLEFKV
jgi:hypothetical protein